MRPTLFLLALLLGSSLACTGGGGSFGGARQLVRLMDQPYEWDSNLSDEEWEAQLSALPIVSRPLKVVCSIPEIAVMAKYTGRDHLGSLYAVMPGATTGTGADITKFDVTSAKPDDPAQGSRETEALAKLKDADIVFIAGPDVDKTWMTALIQKSGTTAPVIDLHERMNQLMTQEPVADPSGMHGVRYATVENSWFWLSLHPTSLAVDSIDACFAEMYPQVGTDFAGWRESWLTELGELDNAMAGILLDDAKLGLNSVIPRRVLVDTPALAWWLHRFDYTVVDVIYTDFTTPPTPDRLQELIAKAKDQKVSLILTTPAYHGPEVDQIAAELQVDLGDVAGKGEFTKVPVPVVEVLLQLNEGEGSDDYVPYQLYNAQKIAIAYKPIIDGLYGIKVYWDNKKKEETKAAKAAEKGETPAEPVPATPEGETTPAEGE